MAMLWLLLLNDKGGNGKSEIVLSDIRNGRG
nr:hypothetical protein BSM_09170 [uncultured archaeon]